MLQSALFDLRQLKCGDSLFVNLSRCNMKVTIPLLVLSFDLKWSVDFLLDHYVLLISIKVD